MAKFIHDQFSKDYLSELLLYYEAGEVETEKQVSGESRFIDLWFVPKPDIKVIEPLGLLGQIILTPCIFEPYRNPVTEDQIGECLSKLLDMKREIQKEAKNNKRKLKRTQLPYLWILTPTISDNILSGYNSTKNEELSLGFYDLGKSLRTGIIAIHQLPVNSETLWLRMLGRGTVQKQAIDELLSIDMSTELKDILLELLYQLQQNIDLNRQNNHPEEREVIMRIRPLFREKLEEVRSQGAKQEKRTLIESLLRSRFGELDSELTAIIDSILQLSSEEFSPLLLNLSNLSKSELIARFNPQN